MLAISLRSRRLAVAAAVAGLSCVAPLSHAVGVEATSIPAVWACAAKSAGAEVLPAVTELGGTVTTPGATAGPVTVNGISVGPESVAPFTIPAVSVPSMSVPFPAEAVQSVSEVAGAAVCAAATDPNDTGAVLPTLTGSICEQLYALINVNGTTSTITQGGTSCSPLTSTPVTSVAAAAGTIVAGYGSLSGPGAVAPGGGSYTGEYQATVWVLLQSNGAPVTVNSCQSNGGAACDTATFNIVD